MKLPGGRKPELQAPRRRSEAGSRPQAFSYYARRTEQNFNVGRAQPREQDVRRREAFVRFWRQRLSFVLMGVIVLVCVGYILQISSNPKIIPLTSGSNDHFLQPTQLYADAATRQLRSSPLNGNKITIDTDGVARKLQQQFPELSAVSVTLPLMSHRPLIYIAPTDPSLVLDGAGGKFILDTNGKALLRAADVADLQQRNLTTVTDRSGLQARVGDEVLPASSVAFISYVSQQLQAKGVAVASYELPASPYELDVRLKGAGYVVKFNLHDYAHMKEQVGTMLAVEKRLDNQGIVPAAYIDVRLVGRAYYR